MPTTISHYNYKFSLDANDFAGGARLTKSELALVNQALRESQTEQDRAQASFNALSKAYLTGKASFEEVVRAYDHLVSKTPEAVAAAKAEAAALAEAKRAADEAAKAQERYNAILEQERQKLEPKRRQASSPDALNFGADYEAKLAQKQQQEIIATRKANATAAEEVLRSQMTKEQRFAQERARLYELYRAGALTHDEYTAAVRRANPAMEEGRAIMDRHKTAVQRYREEIGHLNNLLKQGAIDQRAHSAEVARSRGSLAARAIGMSGIPVLGDLVEKGVAGASVHPAFAAVTVGAASAKMAMSTFLHEAEKIDQVGKGATRLGIRTEEYITLGKAAKRADVDMAELAGGFNKMNKAIGEAAEGGKTQQEAFEKLGLNYKDLAVLSPYEAFKKISDALRNTTDPYQRAAVGAEIFGRESSKLNEVLRMGSAEFDKIYEAARRSGQLFGGEAAEQADRAVKAYERLGASWGVLKLQATLLASGPLEKFFTNLATTITPDTGVGFMERAESSGRVLMDYATLGLASKFLPDNPYAKQQSELPEDKSGNALQAARERKMAADDEAYYKASQDANKTLQEKYDLLKQVTSGMADNSDEAKIMEQAEQARNITLGQQILDLMELKKQQDAATKAKEEAARKEDALNQSARDLIANLQEEQRLRKLTGGHLENAAKQMEVYRLQVKGLSGELLDQAMAEAKAADAAKSREDMDKQIDQAMQHGQTPAEKYEAEIKKLLEWQRAGADVAKIQRLMDNAAKDYFKTMDQGSGKGVEAMEATAANLARVERESQQQFDEEARRKREVAAMTDKVRGQMGMVTPEDQVGWQNPMVTPYDQVGWQEPSPFEPMGTWDAATQSIMVTGREVTPFTSGATPYDQVGWQNATVASYGQVGWQEPMLSNGSTRGEDFAAIGADMPPSQIGVDVARPAEPDPEAEKQTSLLERIATASEASVQRPPVQFQEIGSL